MRVSVEIADYCRDIETYLCRKNDGHLIRVTGPSFDLVAGWATMGVPLKVALEGIDRYFERYYRNGPRRRPVKIDFCEADILDLFDEWRRATGLTASAPALEAGAGSASTESPSGARKSPSLPSHLERVVLRLTSARSGGTLDESFDDVIDRIARELDAARAEGRGVRGEARQRLIDRLADLDRELLQRVRGSLDEAAQADIAREADEELAPFRLGMAPEAFARAREGAIDRLVRDRFRLPTIAFGLS
jgi:hypothetical protein